MLPNVPFNKFCSSNRRGYVTCHIPDVNHLYSLYRIEFQGNFTVGQVHILTKR